MYVLYIYILYIHPKDAEIIPREGIYTCWNPTLGIRFGTLKTPIGPGMDPGMRFGFLASYLRLFYKFLVGG